jgi:putative MFS transporter
MSDRVGRRPLLLWSVVGYTAFTVLTAFSWDIWSFALFQFGARIFLGAEYAVALTMIVEEFPADRRGRALGVLLACAATGTIAVGVLLGVGLQNGPLEWRAFYLVGVVPLLVLTVYRRRIRETRRFQEHRAAAPRMRSFLEPWKPATRRNLVLVGLLLMLRSVPVYGTTAWWAYFAERERGFTSGQVALFIIAAYGLGCLGYYACGRAMERYGRRPTSVVYFAGAITFSIVLFQTRNVAVSFVALMLAVFFGLGIAPLLGAFSTELFPTELRGQSAAWLRNVFEVAGFVFGPALVGILGDHATGAIGNIGDTMTFLMVLSIPVVWLVWRYVPETRGMELEEIAA